LPQTRHPSPPTGQRAVSRVIIRRSAAGRQRNIPFHPTPKATSRDSSPLPAGTLRATHSAVGGSGGGGDTGKAGGSKHVPMLMDQEMADQEEVLSLEETGVHRFAFVIHPLSISFIHKAMRWTRFFPDALIEWLAAWRRPFLVSKMTGGRSPATGQRIEGYLFALSATPRQLLR